MGMPASAPDVLNLQVSKGIGHIKRRPIGLTHRARSGRQARRHLDHWGGCPAGRDSASSVLGIVITDFGGGDSMLPAGGLALGIKAGFTR